MAVDYESFIACLKKEEAEILKQKLSNFVVDFKQRSSHGANLSTKRKLIAAFLAQIVADSDKHLAFVSPDETQAFDEENVSEGWEKLVLSKVFECVFGAPSTDESRSNYVLEKKIQTYGWIEERHLDLALNFNLSLEVAQAELLRINGFRSPRDKLIILQNVLQIIVDLVKKKSNGENTANDALLPTLILVLIRANPPNMISNVKYISRYRNAAEMEKGSNQYCMTNYMSAISFIYNMEAKSLTLNEEEQARSGLSMSPGKFKRALSEQQNGMSVNDEFKQLTSQVTGFFGNIFKEVKSTADEFIKEVSAPANPPSPSRPLDSPAALSQERSSARPSRSAQSPADREQYEIELAIAMSLSEMQDKRGSVDISAYSPTKLGLPPTNPDLPEEEEEEKLVRKNSK
ncbi:hypothetical protein HDV03_004358 [Kappamyces sp. JEL0829]|nr:hypothetical protein HDV03_004358 [Kappamyces sp. JEL0829]